MRRIKRIMPPLLLMTVCAFAVNYFTGFIDSWSSFFFITLDLFWFVWAILIYYVVFYVIMQKGSIRKTYCTLLLYAAGYLLLYLFFVDKTKFSVELNGFAWFKVYFYFGIMLFGALLRQTSGTLKERIDKIGIIPVTGITLLSMILWVVTYWLVTVKQTAYLFQFMIQFSIFVFSGAVLLLAMKLESRINEKNLLFQRVVVPIAYSTLEIYLVQATFKPLLKGLSFPVNWSVFIFMSVIGGLILRQIVSLVFNKKEENHEKKITDSKRKSQ